MSQSSPPHKRYFYRLLAHYVSFYLPAGASIVEFETRTAKARQPLPASPPDRIVLNGCVHFSEDVQDLMDEVRRMCSPATRIVITYYSSLWKPFFAVARRLGLADTGPEQNWVSPSDLRNFLALSGFELVAESQRVLIPIYIPVISSLLNRWLAPLPVFRLFALVNVAVARMKMNGALAGSSVSIIVPARNERGNIEDLVKRVPAMGPQDEIVWVEGHSKDGTWEEIQRVIAAYPARRMRAFRQAGKGKGDAVRLGFAEARAEIVLILDADLSMPPERLPKFYAALTDGTGEFINGSRLVYPMEKRAMRFINMLGNKFFAAAFSFLLGQPLKDTLCGTKALSRAHYDAIARDRKYFGDFDPFGDFDLIFGAARQGLRIVEMPVRYRERVYGETQIQRWAHGWLLLKMTVFAARRVKFI